MLCGIAVAMQPASIADSWKSDLESFKLVREKYLLY